MAPWKRWTAFQVVAVNYFCRAIITFYIVSTLFTNTLACDHHHYYCYYYCLRHQTIFNFFSLYCFRLKFLLLLFSCCCCLAKQIQYKRRRHINSNHIISINITLARFVIFLTSFTQFTVSECFFEKKIINILKEAGCSRFKYKKIITITIHL